MKRFRVQITITEVYEHWVEAEDWEGAEYAANEQRGLGHGDLVSYGTTAEVVEEEDDECEK